MALKELGLRCLQDVALVGFDDHPWAAVSNPPLTVIRQPVLEIGTSAAQILLAMLQGGNLDYPKQLLTCELVIRESCGYKR